MEDGQTTDTQAALRRQLEGNKEIQNRVAQLLMLGMPPTRHLLRQVIKASAAPASVKAAAYKKVNELSPVKDEGCYRIDYYNTKTQGGETVYLVMRQCPRDYDTGSTLGPLLEVLDEDKKKVVRAKLSELMAIVRHLYRDMAEANADMIRGLHPGANEDLFKTQVDLATSTVFIREAWPDRVGLFVVPAPPENEQVRSVGGITSQV